MSSTGHGVGNGQQVGAILAPPPGSLWEKSPRWPAPCPVGKAPASGPRVRGQHGLGRGFLVPQLEPTGRQAAEALWAQAQHVQRG